MNYDNIQGVKVKKTYCSLCYEWRLCRYYGFGLEWLCYRCYCDVKRANEEEVEEEIDYYRIGGCK